MTIESIQQWCKKIKETTRVSNVEAKICSDSNAIVFTITQYVPNKNINLKRKEVFSVKYAIQISILNEASNSAKIGEKNTVQISINILRGYYLKLTKLAKELVKTSNA